MEEKRKKEIIYHALYEYWLKTQMIPQIEDELINNKKNNLINEIEIILMEYKEEIEKNY